MAYGDRKPRSRIEWGVRWWEGDGGRFERVETYDDREEAGEFLRYLRARELLIVDYQEPDFSFQAEMLTRTIPEWTIIEED